MADELWIEEVVSGGERCEACGGTHGIHTVLCFRFRCVVCGLRGPDEDHRGGCPTVRRDEIRWECQCGAFGWLRSRKNRSVAGLVRHARREHHCPDPDVVNLETRDEYEQRKYKQRIHADAF